MRALSYGWDQVHAEAERLEHAASDELVDRMAEAVGEPTTDPHGAPIPSREGVVNQPPHLSLCELPLAAEARVGWVRTEDPQRLRHLAGLGLVPGTPVAVVAREPFGGPITVRCGRRDQLLGPELAAEVMVQSAAAPSTRSAAP